MDEGGEVMIDEMFKEPLHEESHERKRCEHEHEGMSDHNKYWASGVYGAGLVYS
jgi:hypothetical protein